MKTLSTLFLLLFATSFANAQQAGQLYITSYDDTVDISYICQGVCEDTIWVNVGAANLVPDVPITVDSITFQGDSSAFLTLASATNSFILGKSVFYGSGTPFAPKSPGDYRLHVTGYYNGEFQDTANIILHAQNSPDLSMYGYTPKLIEINVFGQDIKFGNTQQANEIDTMHDEIATENSYHIGDSPYPDGGDEIIIGDIPVTLQSCGGATIDSIYEVGDFSEFAFDPFPKLPYTVPGDDSLVFNYEFTPKVVDETGSRHHYLVFHSTDGNYLVWSFEYKVYPTSSVSEIANLNDAIKVFPNPASGELQILGGQAGTIHLFDLMGRERMNANDDGTGATLDVSRLESGIYFLREGNQSAKVEVSK